MRTGIIGLTMAVGLGAAAISASAAPLSPYPATAGNGGVILVADGCGGGWHPVPGHWVAGQWEPTRCAPNDRGGDWSSPYPTYPAYPAYPRYEAYPVPYEAYPYPPERYWDRWY